MRAAPAPRWSTGCKRAQRRVPRGHRLRGDRPRRRLRLGDPHTGAVAQRHLVVDHFPLVKLANDALTRVRRRVTWDLRDRRGRRLDPEWANRRRLLRAGNACRTRVSPRCGTESRPRDPSAQILSAWIAKEELLSAAAASAVLTFLPMLPTQILLNNLLYDSSQLAIPTDRVDDEQLHAPSHWNIAFIRRFMFTFGPISSLFDFLTFGLMLGVLHAGPVEFRTGWFVESLATQTLIIFAIRTRRVPFFRSRPGLVLTLAAFAVVAVGVALTVSPLAHQLGFTTLPWQFFTALVLFTIVYLVLVEMMKAMFTPIRYTCRAHAAPAAGAPHPSPSRPLRPRRPHRTPA